MGFRNRLTRLTPEQVDQLRLQTTEYASGSPREGAPGRLTWGQVAIGPDPQLFLQLQGAGYLPVGGGLERAGAALRYTNDEQRTELSLFADRITLGGTVVGLDQVAYDFPRTGAAQVGFTAGTNQVLFGGIAADAPSGTYLVVASVVLRDNAGTTAGGNLRLRAGAGVIRTGQANLGPATGLQTFITLSAPYAHPGGDLNLALEATIGAGSPVLFRDGSYITAYGPPR